MKLNQLLFISFLFATVCAYGADPVVRSYYRVQTTGGSVGGPISDFTPGTITATWANNNTLQLSLGQLSNLTWEYKGQNTSGYHYYVFKNSSGVIMPGTDYQVVVFSNDWSIMEIHYLFGLVGFNQIPMISAYKFLGNGESIIDPSPAPGQSHECRVCGGKGTRIVEDNVGYYSSTKWCPECQKTVYIGHNHRRCDNCKGSGKVYY